MKKLIITLIVLVILGGAFYYVWHNYGDQIKDKLKNGIDETINAINNDKENIRVFEYFEYNDKDGYYMKDSNGFLVRDVAVGTSYTYEAKTYEHYSLKEIKNGVIAKVEKDGNYVIDVYYNLDKYTITFDGEGVSETDKTKTFKYGYVLQQKDFPSMSKEGYEFKIPSTSVSKDETIAIEWVEIERTLTLELADGCEITDSSYQKVEGSNVYTKKIKYFSTETLPTPTSSIYTFKNYVDKNNNVVTEISHITTDITLNAQFTETTYTITFDCEDGKAYASIIAAKGAQISSPYIQPENQVPGYGLNWYTDNTFTSLFDFHYMPASDMTLYGKWEEDTGVGFLTGVPASIDSYEDLCALYDYVYYSYSTTPIKREVTYVSFENLSAEFNKLAADCDSQYHGNGKIKSSSTSDGSKVEISLYMEADARDYEATLTVAANDYVAYGYAPYKETTGLRSSTYNDFYIEKLTNTYEVETTNQLLYVAEHGYKPICKSGSKAEAAYNKLKEILRNIVSDDMTNFEKADAIFTYLSLNIQYDHNVLDITDGNDDIWPKYDSYFMEGVLNNHKSVCDGIAKTFSMLCNMEGIPCVEVTGNSHAWCKCKINNIWYVVDATHGNTQLPAQDPSDDNRSIMNHGEFLISDANKAAKGYVTKDYSNIKCLNNFNYFDYKVYETSSGDIKLVVESVSDFEKILAFCQEQYADLDGYCVEFYYNTDLSFDTYMKSKIFALGYGYSSVPFGPYQIGKIIFTK